MGHSPLFAEVAVELPSVLPGQNGKVDLTLIFSRGRSRGGGRLLQILSLRRGANSKRGAYLKLGVNSSIYGSSKLNNTERKDLIILGCARTFFGLYAEQPFFYIIEITL